MKFIPKKSGETIIEVLIATVLLVAVLASSFVALNRASQANTNVGNRIVAINLAREGIEAVRNIRDTNWLQYSGNKREKWLCLDGESGPGCVSSIISISDGFYQINFSETKQRYFLDDFDATELDIPGDSDGLDFFLLYKDSKGRFTHYDEDGDGVANTPTRFYRQIELKKSNNSLCLPANCEEKKLEVVSRVGWIEGNLSKNVILETHLFDFYQRDEY